MRQILRVIPYSATQLYSYEVLKKAFADRDGKLSVPARLGAGACAGMAATLVRDLGSKGNALHPGLLDYAYGCSVSCLHSTWVAEMQLQPKALRMLV